MGIYPDKNIAVYVEKQNLIFVRFDLDPALFGKGFYPVLVEQETGKIQIRLNAGVDIDCRP